MKLKIIKIGKIATKEIVSLVASYEKRLKLFCAAEFIELKDLDLKNNSTISKTELYLQELKTQPGTFLILLDERGKQFSSPNLAKFISDKIDNPQIKTLIFVVGGAYGFNSNARLLADYCWSLSEGVFPNELAWLMTCEQIYRAYSIIKGTSYHHE